MKVTLLGTGGPLPDPDRAGPATLVQVGGLNLLFDCGRGVLMRLAAAGIQTPALVNVQFLTHLHSDHVTDFNDLVTSRWVFTFVPSPLSVVGPPGTQVFTDRTLESMRDDIGWRRAHHDDLNWDPGVEVQEVLDGPLEHPILNSAGVTVTAAPTDHRPVAPTVGYRIDHDGRSVVIAGDTVPCDGLDRLVSGAGVYVQTVVREDLVSSNPLARVRDVLDYQSSVRQAAETATRGGVDTLVLTHMVPAPAPGDQDEWIKLASEHFDGEVVAPDDLGSIDL